MHPVTIYLHRPRSCNRFHTFHGYSTITPYLACKDCLTCRHHASCGPMPTRSKYFAAKCSGRNECIAAKVPFCGFEHQGTSIQRSVAQVPASDFASRNCNCACALQHDVGNAALMSMIAKFSCRAHRKYMRRSRSKSDRANS